jgi:hypothetical protein
MEHYYVDRVPRNTGEHQIHISGCPEFPKLFHHLGTFFTYQEARRDAEIYFDQVTNCVHCCRDLSEDNSLLSELSRSRCPGQSGERKMS